MIKIIIQVIIALFITITSAHGQKNGSFEQKAKRLSIKIDSITLAERSALKKDIKAIEKQYNNDEEITIEEVESLKKEAALLHANNIKEQVAKVEEELHSLVQNKVDNKMIPTDTNQTMIYFGSKGIKIRKENQRKNKRTYSYTVIAFGLNNLINNEELNSIQDSPFEFGGSRFFEFGVNYKTRIFNNASVPYINYGLSVRYNNLRFKNDQYFVAEDNQTLIVDHPENLKKSNFKNVQLVVPVFLEFDFSKPRIKEDKKIFRRNRNFRFGFGGFGGINIKSKQVLKYNLDGKKIKDKTKGDFNVNRFVYGLNAFIGFKDTSFYVKYDLQDLFKDSFEKQKNLSFGIRFDL